MHLRRTWTLAMLFELFPWLTILVLLAYWIPGHAEQSVNDLLQEAQQLSRQVEANPNNAKLRDKELRVYYKFLKLYKTDDWTRYAMLRNFELALYKSERYNQSIVIAKQLLTNKYCVEELSKDLASESDQICFVKTINRLFNALHKAKKELEPATRELFEKFVVNYRFKGKQKIFWGSEFQFPLFSAPNLEAKPWWPSDLPGAVALKKGYAKIRKEGLQLLKTGKIRPRTADAGLTMNGKWQDFTLGEGEMMHLNPLACQEAPATCGVVNSDPNLKRGSLLGQAAFLVLAPGTRLAIHAGRRNDRINMQLALKIPKGSLDKLGLRAGDPTAANATRGWTEGEVMVFDDSFVHEAWNYAKEPRMVFQMFHPHPDGTGYRSEKKLRKLEL